MKVNLHRPKAALALSLLCGAGPALAQDEPLPSFATCMDITVARYEQDLIRLRARPDAMQEFDIGDVRRVEYCGTVGIVLCDRSEGSTPCQQALAAEQDALTAQVLASLPEPSPAPDPEQDPVQAPEQVPDQVPEQATEQNDVSFAAQLYPQVWALARGSSAGLDCDGMVLQLEVWCEAREANSRLRIAVLAWQVARYLSLADPAVEAGWARPPPPTRPKARPDPQQ